MLPAAHHPKRRTTSTSARSTIGKMPPPAAENVQVAVIGAGPAGVVAALRCARLGARTTLVTSDDFGGMAAGDGPVLVRALAHAARLMREARGSDHALDGDSTQLGRL